MESVYLHRPTALRSLRRLCQPSREASARQITRIEAQEQLPLSSWFDKLVCMKEKTIGAFEAKTHLSRLLAEVEAGQSISITKRGKVVAQLVPPPSQRADAAALLARLQAFRARTKHGKGPLRELIDEGRRR
jgi:prevent-host-death family protein